MDGVGFWARMCESQGDFEVPDNKCKTHDNPAFNKRPTRESKRLIALNSREKGNQDRPNKEQVDKQQEEMEGLTWADRWYQNKQVQKVVQHSQLFSKVRSNIKIKLKAADGLADQITNVSPSGSANLGSDSPVAGVASTSEPGSTEDILANDEIPATIIGSMKEYAKIVGKTTEQIEREQLEEVEKHSDVEESDEEGEGGDDDLSLIHI